MFSLNLNSATEEQGVMELYCWVEEKRAKEKSLDICKAAQLVESWYCLTPNFSEDFPRLSGLGGALA